MSFMDNIDKLLREIKSDVRFIEKYLDDMENDNIINDTWTVDNSIQNIIDNATQLFNITD